MKGVEDVTTPAGAFRSYRLYAIWRWFSDAGTALGHAETEDWLSPQVRFFVMGRTKEGTYTSEYELAEYHLTP
ncbi:MAG: hypothetical protein QN162_10090 [Armatimonadota bacterium]|nr:hypothetical protein [Armatimonadota bacterium]